MNSQNLKEWIKDDIETIKTLEPDIIPSNVFYKEMLSIYKWVVVFFLLTPYMFICLSHIESMELEAYPIILGVMSFIFFLIITPVFFIYPTQLYVVFKKQFYPHLKSGKVCMSMMHKIASTYLMTYLCVFGVGFLLANFALGSEGSGVAGMVLGTLLGNIIAYLFTYIYLSSEISRIGLMSLYQAIASVRSS